MKIFNQLEKISYNQLKNAFYIAKIVCFIYAFFCIVYWFLNLINPSLVSGFSLLFEPVFNLVKLFYEQKTIDPTKTDLAGVITCFIFIIFAIIAHICISIVEQQEEKARVALIKKTEEENRLTQIQIQQEYIAEMKKYNRFIILVDFNISQIKSYLFDNNMDEKDLKMTKLKLMSELFSSISAPYIQKKAMIENKSFYIIGKIEHTPETIHMITSTIRSLSKKYSNLDISLTHDLSFDAISNNTNIEEKLEFLEKVIQLNYDNCTLTTSLFKTCYELISKATMKFTVLGKFQFIVNDKSSNYELYSVKII